MGMNLFRLILTEVQLRTDMLIFSASNWSNCLPQLQNEFCYACQKQTNAVSCPFLNCLQSMCLFGFEVNTRSQKNISFYFFNEKQNIIVIQQQALPFLPI